MPKISPEESMSRYEAILALRKQGYRTNYIARKLNISANIVLYHTTKAVKNGEIPPLKKPKDARRMLGENMCIAGVKVGVVTDLLAKEDEAMQNWLIDQCSRYKMTIWQYALLKLRDEYIELEDKE